MIRSLTFFLLFLLVGLVTDLSAQHTQYRFSKLDANDGLSHNQIKSFFKDSNGFLWVGTISGLNRYDGYSFKVFRNDPRNPKSIINDDINRMFEDPEGRIWIVTWSGLDIYDPVTETFRQDASALIKKIGLPDGNVTDIRKDKQGNFWFVHASAGLFYYNVATQKTLRLSHNETDPGTPASNSLSSIQFSSQGDVWIFHKNGLLELFSVKDEKIKKRFDYFYSSNDSPRDYAFVVDSDDDLWIYVSETNRGIFHFSASTEKFTPINRSSSGIRLSSDIVRGIVEDNNKLIWVATDHGGINVINKKSGNVDYILHSPKDDKSLSQNSINTIYKDNEGIIWAGTFKQGISFYHQNIIRFPLYRQNFSAAGGLQFDDINAFAEDEKGNIWIGTNGGGLIYYDRKNDTFKQYLHNPNDPTTLSNNVIVSLCYDHTNTLWIGTYFGGLNSFDGKKFTRYRHNPKDTTSISDDNVWEIYEDSQKRLWIGTLSRGIDVFDRSRKKITSFRIGARIPIHASYVPAFMEDTDGNMWVGTGYGLEVLKKGAKEFTHYLSETNNANSLSNNSILSIFQDSRGLIWIGTHGGLNLFNKSRNSFFSYTTESGLPHNTVLAILEDNDRNLWLSTANGLSKFVIRDVIGDSISGTFHNYDEFDGLQGKQFNENAVLKTSSGELMFAGGNGFNLFNPSLLRPNQYKPKIVLTDFQVLNRPVKIGEPLDGRVMLEKSLNFTDEIVLRHADNVFSLEFAALNFYHPEKILYKYKLEGFDRDWTTKKSSERRVTYTNLDPGEYVFKVIASNNDGLWNEKGLEIRLKVLPPFWRSNVAMVIYVFLILLALFITRKLIQKRERMKFLIEQERQEAKRMHELDMMKIKFFTNVSHEFRTPLTLILTPVERMLDKADPVQQKQFQLIYRNAKRLLNLVNQLLDFRKLEVQEVRYNPSEGDIVQFIRETVFSFSDLSEKKDIRLEFSTRVEKLETFFDQDKLEKILFNLLSNAFKFTQEHGRVSVELDVLNGKELEIKVSDTGIGIPPDKIDKIFERFFQNDLPGSMVNQGSGIGLSITKEFVKAHGGVITVESEVGKGSEFRVLLPVTEVTSVRPTPSLEPVNIVTQQADTHNTELHSEQSKLPAVLLVEDNEDFRFYLKDNLRLHYRVLEAKDGNEGWDKILSALPDLVVSDVMMPQMNGLELCRKIKHDQRVSHVPVILLTARTAEEQKLEGFESGADDYITKPFNFEILQSRIRNLIQKRQLFHKEFRQKIEVKASHVEITSLDQKLIQKAVKVVEEKISDADFSVEELSRELGMSRVHLYKKLHALTGKSPLEFIRTIRLQHAAQLLEKSQLTVAEIAYKVGFNNPKYFAKYFKEEYQVLPSAYAASRRSTSS